MASLSLFFKRYGAPYYLSHILGYNYFPLACNAFSDFSAVRPLLYWPLLFAFSLKQCDDVVAFEIKNRNLRYVVRRHFQ
jgi:hypothetical protein